MTLHRSLLDSGGYFVDTCSKNFQFDTIADYVYNCPSPSELDLTLLDKTFSYNSLACMVYRTCDVRVPRGVLNESQGHATLLRNHFNYLFRYKPLPSEVSQLLESDKLLLEDMASNLASDKLSSGLLSICYNFVKDVGNAHLDRADLVSLVDEEVVAHGLSKLISSKEPVTLITYDTDIKKLLSKSILEISNTALQAKVNGTYKWMRKKVDGQGIGVYAPKEIGKRDLTYHSSQRGSCLLKSRTIQFMLAIDRFK